MNSHAGEVNIGEQLIRIYYSSHYSVSIASGSLSNFDFTERPLLNLWRSQQKTVKLRFMNTANAAKFSIVEKLNTGPPVKSKEHMRNQLQTELCLEMSLNVFVLS